MFRIDHASNRITKLSEVRFADIGFRERQHLQEWLANQPDALGEDLLVIQKEFDGFDDTRERLDLLAIDKEGALVVIENKLDDSGRDVVWQAIKYASYCSTLSKNKIAEVFQRYLDKIGVKGDARALICEFLGEEDFEEVVLNTGHDQRLILVAAQFRKEVTSTVLWLLSHRIRVKCFKATPYKDGDALFLNLEQIIPLRGAEELMIGISEKESEEQSSERGQATRHLLRTEFWQRALEALGRAGITLYANVAPSRGYWLSAGSGLAGVPYTMVFNKDEARVELSIGRAYKEENKAVFDALFAEKERIETDFGAPLEWRRLDDKKASIIAYGAPFNGHDRESWPAIVEWFVEHVRKLQATFGPRLPRLKSMLREEHPRAH